MYIKYKTRAHSTLPWSVELLMGSKGTRLRLLPCARSYFLAYKHTIKFIISTFPLCFIILCVEQQHTDTLRSPPRFNRSKRRPEENKIHNMTCVWPNNKTIILFRLLRRFDPPLRAWKFPCASVYILLLLCAVVGTQIYTRIHNAAAVGMRKISQLESLFSLLCSSTHITISHKYGMSAAFFVHTVAERLFFSIPPFLEHMIYIKQRPMI